MIATNNQVSATREITAAGKPKVLIVEDDVDTRLIARRALTLHGYDVIEAGDGVSAFELARRQCPALIVLDMGLPGIDGWTVAGDIRAEPALQHVPILAITGYGMATAHRAAIEYGCTQAICKPFKMNTFVQVVSQLLTAQ